MTSAYPSLSTQVIGQAESTLGAILDPLLGRTGTTFHQWLVLTVTAADGSVIDRGRLIARITHARKLSEPEVEAAIAELTSAGLIQSHPGTASVSLTGAGQARYDLIRTALGEVTDRLFGDIPSEDLTIAGRVLGIITERANAELAAT